MKYSTISTIKLPGVTGEDLCKTEVETKIKKIAFIESPIIRNSKKLELSCGLWMGTRTKPNEKVHQWKVFLFIDIAFR